MPTARVGWHLRRGGAPVWECETEGGGEAGGQEPWEPAGARWTRSEGARLRGDRGTWSW